ncbi:MAG: helix-turn-helix domain-containing protein [Geodermatophilaceae bacterium]
MNRVVHIIESALIRLRTREGMKVAKAKGRLRGKKPKLKPNQEAHLAKLHAAGEHTSAELAELFGVARSTVYRTVKRGERPAHVIQPAAAEGRDNLEGGFR